MKRKRPAHSNARRKHPFLAGKRITLRLLEESDVTEEYLRWLNDPEVCRYLETGKFPSTRRSVRDYLKRFHRSKTDLIFGIFDKETDLHIGNVTLNRINWIHRTSDTGILIGRKEFWGKGYALEAWGLLLDYAFRRLGLRKMIAGAVAENKASIRTLQKLGFKQEGRFRREFLVDGKYRDAVRLGLFKEDRLK